MTNKLEDKVNEEKYPGNSEDGYETLLMNVADHRTAVSEIEELSDYLFRL